MDKIQPRTHYLAHGVLLFCLSIGVTIGAWAVASGHPDVRDVTPVDVRMPQLPTDMEERLNNAIKSPAITVIQLLDPFSQRPAQEAAARQRKGSTETPNEPPVPSFAERYGAWRRAVQEARAKGTDEPALTTIYLLNEIQAVGIVKAAGKNQALLQVIPEKRDFTAPIGSRFFFGTLAAITSDGIKFSTGSGTKLLPWEPSPSVVERPPKPPVTTDSETQGTNPVQKLQNAVKEWPKKKSPEPQTKPPQGTGMLVPNGRVRSDDPMRAAALALTGSYDQFDGRLFLLTEARFSVVSAADWTPIPLENLMVRSGRHRELVDPDEDGHFSFSYGLFAAGANCVQEKIEAADPGPNGKQAETSAAKNQSQVPAQQETPSRPRTIATLQEPKNPEVKAESSHTPAAAAANPAQPSVASFCEPAYIGPPASIDTTRQTTLITLTEFFFHNFGVNFLVDPEVQELPIRASINDAPWTAILRNILEVNNLVANCDGTIVRIMSKTKLDKLGADRRKAEPIHQKVFTLRYIQPATTGIKNITGQQVQSSNALQTLEESIKKILHAGGDDRGDVTRIPGRNELIVAGSDEQLKAVTTLIERVDRPTYQVEINALVYAINDNYLRDYGNQLSGLAANGSQSQLGGLSTLPNGSPSGGGQSGGQTSTGGGRQPGGIPGLATNLKQPSGILGAANPAGLLGFSAIVGTSQFASFLSLAEQKGRVNVQARPFGTVADGQPLELNAGDDIPVATSVIAGGANVPTGGITILQAGKVLSILPQVAEDDAGNPTSVTLTIRIESNSVDTTLGTFGGLPSVARQSLQTVIRLTDGQTGIVGGLAADSVARTSSKIPLLGSIPVVGSVFSRKTRQDDRSRLYFAITAKIIPVGGSLNGVPVPSDAYTALPPPGDPQNPGPYNKIKH